MTLPYIWPTNLRKASSARRYVDRRHWLDSIKIAAGCKDCGCDMPAEVLTFDHVRGEKKFNIGQSWNAGLIALEEEIAKCEIVCANCHAKRTKQRCGEEEPAFEPFTKIARLNRDITITEKIDGTNATVWVDGEGDVWASSRNRWLPRGGGVGGKNRKEDNYGFAAWVAEHEEEFQELGPCVMRGEWWGQGIQRKYGLTTKRYSLFNTNKWNKDTLPLCCDVVPVLYTGPFKTDVISTQIERLRTLGSVAAPGFMKPEGIVVYHTHANQYFKVTLEHDELPKSLAPKEEPMGDHQPIPSEPELTNLSHRPTAYL